MVGVVVEVVVGTVVGVVVEVAVRAVVGAEEVGGRRVSRDGNRVLHFFSFSRHLIHTKCRPPHF